jgi:hypothetical protein
VCATPLGTNKALDKVQAYMPSDAVRRSTASVEAACSQARKAAEMLRDVAARS